MAGDAPAVSHPPLNFAQWIDAHRPLLRPPVGNAQVWPDREFMVTVVGGPNARSDFHINEGEEFFYQLEGEVTLLTLQGGQRVPIVLQQGDIFLLPANVPHSPQRPAGTVGLVLERRRLPHEIDQFLWICDRCDAELHRERLHLTDIVSQLPPAFDRYWSSPDTTCKACGHLHSRAR
ncbi:MAG: 3-hydroxyanthranilate 3,4-dioxygenase [Deltaproteobacteria bacterium]|nr:3-hydroxyanthranilate 3,4-dioxygenase [Deltaproteobacteria bacterium]